MDDPNVIRVAGTDRVFHRRNVLVVILISLAMSLLAVSAINVALPTIEAGLGATSSDLQWVLAGYALSFGVVLISAGRAGDVFGHGSLFVAGMVVFTIASLACGLAPTPMTLNLARFLQGIGSGMFNPQIMGMLLQYFTGFARARAFALFGMVISVSVAIGPVLAGAIIEGVGPENGWRAMFFINVPIGVLGIVLALRWLPFGVERNRAHRRRTHGAVRESGRIDLDPVGALLVAGAVLAVMWPFMARESGPVWLLVPGGLALLALWVLWERRYKAAGREPMVDLTLFTYPSFTHGTAVAGTLFLGAPAVFAVLAIYLQSGPGFGALATGLVGLPNAALSAFGSWWGGQHVLKRGRHLVVLGLTSLLAGVLLSIVVVHLASTAGWSFWWLALTLGAAGWGMGITNACNQTLSMEDIPARTGGTAGGVKQTAERIGTAVGTAMVTAVFFAVTTTAGWERGFTAAYAVIAVVLIVALLLALADQRGHRRRSAHP